MTKYIFVTGGVVSGLGKGITAASLGRLLKTRGLKVAAQKLDPYINVDPGTMSPYQHGEVFVTEDGAETDLDLGHYERFIDEDLNQYSNLTTGKVYWNVLTKERNGAYLGQTVQAIPHITNEIKGFIYSVGQKTKADVIITEIGGTTGDIESQPFLEAIRQVSLEVGRENCLFIHVTLVPYIASSGEYKSKPTQHSVKELRSMGIAPDMIVPRCDAPITEEIRHKIALFCNVKPDCVIENLTVPVLYEAPNMLEKSHFSDIVCRELNLSCPPADLSEWNEMLLRIKHAKRRVRIALVGKYVQLHDAYLSVAEALRHGGYENGVDVDIQWVDAEQVTPETVGELLGGAGGILVPGGFGDRGIEGKIAAAQYARKMDIPYLGICLGMQTAVIEFARHAAGLDGANSSEFAPNSPHPVIDLMPDQQGNLPKGGTMRLGAYPCRIQPGSIMEQAYQVGSIAERHRHRYEFNNAYRDILTAHGLRITGTSPDERLVEAIEIPGLRFFIGVQYHPEFKSRPNRAHPLFREFIRASAQRRSANRDYALETQKRVAYIKNALASAGARGIVFGNSGGKDSALVGILCKKACNEVLGVIMPCQSSRNYGEDREDGLALAAQYGIETKLVDLTQVKQAELSALEAAGSLSPAASANIAPRLRMTTLYAIGQSRGYLVAGTGNASERYMGYFTKWGDGAFDFNPIADLTVTEIYEFLRYLGAPSRIIEKAPSAGLYEGQTDEQELGITYQAIDRYLMEGSAGPLEMEKIQRAHSRSMHKLAEANIYKEE